jgi:predicted amidohydrolase YtcJ
MTMAEGDSGAPAVVAIRDGRIAAVRPGTDTGELVGPDTRVLDFGDRVVVPGFIDVHAHMEVAARTLYETVDCRAPACTSIDDVLAALSDAKGEARDGWLVGQGNLFFDQKLSDRRLPDRNDLDRVSTEIAIAIRAGGHITALNSRALELAGVGEDLIASRSTITGTPVVDVGSDGRPTGVVKEMDNLLPFPRLEGAELRAAILEGAQRLFVRHGVTKLGEISESVEGLGFMRQLTESGELPLNIAAYIWAPGTLPLEDACEWGSDFEPGRFVVKGVKLFADGGFSAGNAAVKRPYRLTGKGAGTVSLSPEEIAGALERTTRAGRQLAIHANGDRAQEVVCDAIANAGGAPEDPKLRTRLEHGGNFVPDPDLPDAWRRAGVVPVPQTVFIYTSAEFFPPYLGEYAWKGLWPLRSLKEEGWELSASSDVWVGSENNQTNPLFGVWCAVARRTFHDQLLPEADEALSVEDALRMYTTGGAAALGELDERGTLEPGKVADLAVLERDPATAPLEELKTIGTDFVMVDGEVAYERPGAPHPDGGRQ